MPPPSPYRSLQLEGVALLPLWAQVLTAARITQRVALATDELKGRDRQEVLAACEELTVAAELGALPRVRFDAVRTTGMHIGQVPGANFVGMALYHTADAALGADGTQDPTGIGSSCIAAVRKAINALLAEDRFGPFQVRIAVAADADQLAFACGEVNTGIYEGLGAHVLGRLPPIHPLTPFPPSTTLTEADFR